MKRRYTLSIAALAGLMMFSFQTASARTGDNVRLAIELYPPFAFHQPDGKLDGFEVELGNLLCERAQLNCTWVEQTWDGMIPGLLARKYDAILSSLSITTERSRQVLFSHPYYNTPHVWVVPNESTLAPEKTDAIKGKNIGVQRGTTRDYYLTKLYGDTNTVRRYASEQEISNDLESGRLDAALVDYTTAVQTFKIGKPGSRYRQAGPALTKPVDIFGPGIGMAFRPRDKALAEKFNAAIDDVYRDGSFQKVMHKYMDYDISVHND